MLCFSLELPRALAEGALFASSERILRWLPSGDGHPVVVLPGFLGDDHSTHALRYHLRCLGYVTHGWRLGRNLGPTAAVVEGLAQLVGSLAERHGCTVSLVGWSLGGIYARELAFTRPELVRTVITLGSPFRALDASGTRADRLYRRYEKRHDAAYRAPSYAPPTGPLRVPSTAVYTRTDGVVAWRDCIQSSGPISENIEVIGSHCGLGHHPAVIYAVSDRLARPDGEWTPFRPPAALRLLFPRPAEPEIPATRPPAQG
jgi:pimeloyl-ACP methyl ester carboxylesterase